MGENIYIQFINKGLIFKIYKVLTTINNKNSIGSSKNGKKR